MAIAIKDWSQETEEDVNGSKLRLITLSNGGIEAAKANVAKAIPSHYASRIADVLKKFGKTGAAKLLKEKLPTKNNMRSGDLGEIIATEYIGECTNYQTPVKRLQWKDSRDLPMRGDDVIGMQIMDDSTICFLKVEAKSRTSLNTATVADAREALNDNDGLPTSHSLLFISEQLTLIGESELADAIDGAVLREGISKSQVSQMIFTLSGNSPDGFLRTDLQNYKGGIDQISVGLQIEDHQEFIGSVYAKALEPYES